jgi:hypothetical protein
VAEQYPQWPDNLCVFLNHNPKEPSHGDEEEGQEKGSEEEEITSRAEFIPSWRGGLKRGSRRRDGDRKGESPGGTAIPPRTHRTGSTGVPASGLVLPVLYCP